MMMMSPLWPQINVRKIVMLGIFCWYFRLSVRPELRAWRMGCWDVSTKQTNCTQTLRPRISNACELHKVFSCDISPKKTMFKEQKSEPAFFVFCLFFCYVLLVMVLKNITTIAITVLHSGLKMEKILQSIIYVWVVARLKSMGFLHLFSLLRRPLRSCSILKKKSKTR